MFARPEKEMLEAVPSDNSNLNSVVCFLLDCTKARKYIEPFPLNELPWGPTQAFFDFRLKLHNQSGPIIPTWGGKRRLVIEASEAMIMQHQMFDSDGMELEVRTFILKEEKDNKFTFTIAPPRTGTFKLMLFGMPKPKQKGKWRLPLLATFMIDCKLARLPQMDDDPPPVCVTSGVVSPTQHQHRVDLRRERFRHRKRSGSSKSASGSSSRS